MIEIISFILYIFLYSLVLDRIYYFLNGLTIDIYHIIILYGSNNFNKLLSRII